MYLKFKKFFINFHEQFSYIIIKMKLIFFSVNIILIKRCLTFWMNFMRKIEQSKNNTS